MTRRMEPVHGSVHSLTHRPPRPGESASESHPQNESIKNEAIGSTRQEVNTELCPSVCYTAADEQPITGFNDVIRSLIRNDQFPPSRKRKGKTNNDMKSENMSEPLAVCSRF